MGTFQVWNVAVGVGTGVEVMVIDCRKGWSGGDGHWL